MNPKFTMCLIDARVKTLLMQARCLFVIAKERILYCRHILYKNAFEVLLHLTNCVDILLPFL